MTRLKKHDQAWGIKTRYKIFVSKHYRGPTNLIAELIAADHHSLVSIGVFDLKEKIEKQMSTEFVDINPTKRTIEIEHFITKTK